MEPRPEPIVRHRTHSLDQSLPYIGELMKHGQITLGNYAPWVRARQEQLAINVSKIWAHRAVA
jgi:hypothetical protein